MRLPITKYCKIYSLASAWDRSKDEHAVLLTTNKCGGQQGRSPGSLHEIYFIWGLFFEAFQLRKLHGNYFPLSILGYES